MAVTPPVCDFGWKAPDFTLPATDGRTVSLADISGPKGTLVMFICNHCPYVLAVLDRIIRDAAELQELGVGVVAISSNDVAAYPQDSFENMALLASDRELPFPYLYDADQSIARGYDAACTPDFFGFNSDLELQYRGRLDGSTRAAGADELRRDLFEAMKLVAATGIGPAEQIASMGCSIKWKDA
ncbi:thioredoxin family protein [Parasedimentitalea huanghaiensis]|uniref:Redoxin domain-containing protein n=1 Tax=Parasedimentitalea huanghaiensis TaxID=2682100 RepID=A0A6L6WQ67_9RHOB|nr:thioredoxin family protein [Zongyanglinia huanghaiensis]MVO18067.1 redoxin domain-containing protein [Zongyanglinia huanghaiensis]